MVGNFFPLEHRVERHNGSSRFEDAEVDNRKLDNIRDRQGDAVTWAYPQ